MFDHFIGFDAAWCELLMEKGCHGREVELTGHFWILSDAVGHFWILPESFGISWIPFKHQLPRKILLAATPMQSCTGSIFAGLGNLEHGGPGSPLYWKPPIALGLGVEKWWQVLGSEWTDASSVSHQFGSSSTASKTSSNPRGSPKPFRFCFSVHNSVLHVLRPKRILSRMIWLPTEHIWNLCMISEYLWNSLSIYSYLMLLDRKGAHPSAIVWEQKERRSPAIGIDPGSHGWRSSIQVSGRRWNNMIKKDNENIS